MQLYLIPDQRAVEVQPGETLLSASLRGGVPHMHTCGGRARCSTCRLLIQEGLEHCEPPGAAELALTTRLHLPSSVRLACQTTIHGSVTARRLIMGPAESQQLRQRARAPLPDAMGEERQAAILFADIRGFTSFTEALLPYDVIHVLNSYFARSEVIVQQHGGFINNYMGDGLLALFIGPDQRLVARHALAAGQALLAEMADLNQTIKLLYERTLQLSIGLHVGNIILGAVGGGQSRRVCAIGDAVNTASRIEAANRGLGSSFLISEEVYQLVREHVTVRRSATLTLRGKSGNFTLYEVDTTARPLASQALGDWSAWEWPLGPG